MGGNITKRLGDVCEQLATSSKNKIVNSHEEYVDVIESTDRPRHGIFFDQQNQRLYTHLKQDICINLYKELGEKITVNKISQTALDILNRQSEVISDGLRHTIALKEGDIKINFAQSTLSEKISDSKFDKKNVALISAGECFMQKISPGGRSGPLNTLVTATEKDIKTILSYLDNLLDHQENEES